MDELLSLVKTYRFTPALDQRLQLADRIFRIIEPDLRFFVFAYVRGHDGTEVLHETLKAIVLGLGTFTGQSSKEFYAWCYRIARNKRADFLRKRGSDRLDPVPLDEMREIIDASSQYKPISPGVRHDLDYAMNLLAAAKPECHELLWQHFVIGSDYAEIAQAWELTYDAARMKIGRCLEEAKSLVT